MSEERSLIDERKVKLEQWKAFGFGYASKYDRTHTAAQASAEIEQSKNLREPKEIIDSPKSDQRVCGRIMNVRDMGNIAFLKLRDQSGDFQVCFMKNVLGDKHKEFLKIFDLGDFIGVAGEFFVTKHGEPSLMALEITPLSKSLHPLPEKFHGLTNKEACYRQRYLDLLTNRETLERFQTRTKIVKYIEKYLDDRGFLDVELPILEGQAGGAMARVFETYHNDYHMDMVLRIALELPLKMLTVGGIERVYETGKIFRNEGSDPSHLQEFTMLEWYAAYADLEQNMDWTEEMLRGLMNDVMGKTKYTVYKKDGSEVEVEMKEAWPRVAFGDLLKEYASFDMFTASDEEMKAKAKELGMSDEDIKTTGKGNTLDFIFKKSARPKLITPHFVMDYPSELKPLARPKGDGTAECYQLVVAGMEIINSYGELIDPQVQRQLLEDQAAARAAGDDEAMEVDETFLRAMEHGMPPMTGFGMGIDRLVAILTEQKNLRDTIFFPIMKPEGHNPDAS